MKRLWLILALMLLCSIARAEKIVNAHGDYTGKTEAVESVCKTIKSNEALLLEHYGLVIKDADNARTTDTPPIAMAGLRGSLLIRLASKRGTWDKLPVVKKEEFLNLMYNMWYQALDSVKDSGCAHPNVAIWTSTNRKDYFGNPAYDKVASKDEKGVNISVVH